MDLFVQSFLDAVGAEGTVLFPLFNFGFSNGEPFDIRNTPSKMGKLTEAARLHPDAVRTGHPVYSFAVIGAKADRFKGIDNRTPPPACCLSASSIYPAQLCRAGGPANFPWFV